MDTKASAVAVVVVAAAAAAAAAVVLAVAAAVVCGDFPHGRDKSFYQFAPFMPWPGQVSLRNSGGVISWSQSPSRAKVCGKT